MSYEKTFHHTFRISGTITGHYPASENGGTIELSYTDTLPVDVNVYVDTAPFDKSIGVACDSIDSLSGSVVGMTAAQVAAIDKSAQLISSSLSNGFYRMAGQDLSEKKATWKTQLKAKFALLMQYANAMESLMTRMDEDTSRLKRHYSEIFTGLDEDLRKRILQLNRTAFHISNGIRNEILIEPFVRMASVNADLSNQGTYTGNMIYSARTNHKLTSLMDMICGYVERINEYRKRLRAVQESDGSDTVETEYVPVLYVQESSLKNPQVKDERCFIADINNRTAAFGAVSQYVSANTNAAPRYINPEELTRLDREFSALVENSFSSGAVSDKDQRVYREVMNMWNKNKNRMTVL